MTARGDFVGGAQVGVSEEQGSAFVTTGPDGHFELEVSSPTGNVFATAPGLAAEHARQVAAGTKDLMLVLNEPAALRGSVDDVAALPHLFVRLCHYDADYRREVCVKSTYSSPPSNRFELDRLPSGDFDLVFASESAELARVPVRLVPGQMLDVQPVKLAALERPPHSR